ncbi:hypothetical protein [Paenibacillus sp. PL91]|uniref:hypothetical protein n=1 Tax=Paenibacillus sp. PL91 TaxID=2729538 RepID=UPI0039838A16
MRIHFVQSILTQARFIGIRFAQRTLARACSTSVFPTKHTARAYADRSAGSKALHPPSGDALRAKQYDHRRREMHAVAFALLK